MFRNLSYFLHWPPVEPKRQIIIGGIIYFLSSKKGVAVNLRWQANMVCKVGLRDPNKIRSTKPKLRSPEITLTEELMIPTNPLADKNRLKPIKDVHHGPGKWHF